MAKENIELRSEKVRNIIGQIPHAILRRGIGIIFLVFIVLFIVLFLFKCDDSINTVAILEYHQDELILKIKIPSNKNEKIKIGQKVLVYFNRVPNINNEKIEVVIRNKTNVLSVYSDGGFYIYKIYLSNNLKAISGKKLEINNTLEVNVKINVGKVRLIDKILKL